MSHGFTQDLLLSIWAGLYRPPDGGGIPSGEARAIAANKSVKTAPSLMNIMVFAVGRRGRDGCTGERKNAKLVREGRKVPVLYTLDTPSGVFVK